MPKRRKKKPAPQRTSKVARIGNRGEEEERMESEGDLVKMFAEEVGEEEEEEEEEEEVTAAEAEEEDGGGDEEGVSGEGEGGKKKAQIAGLYRPPTHEELQSLKETQNLFQSNLMRLQITELLGEIRPRPSPQLDELLGTIRSTIMAMPTTSPIDLCEALQHLPSKTHYPIDLDPSTVKGKFHFRPPVAVKVVGSYLLKTAIKPDVNVDLVLRIPQECLQAKDHLNYRYLHKRALYLCHIAAHLRKKRKKCGLNSVKFSLSSGGPLLPIIVLVAEGKPLSHYSIRLHTSIPNTPFKLAKLAPDRNNLRQHALKQLPTHLHELANLSDLTDDSKEDTTTDPLNLPPTPHYNSMLLLEMGGLERHLEELYSALQECPAMADAVMLYKVWARQRGLDQEYGGFGGFHFSMLVAMLLSQRKISGLMSSYQILRVALQFIAASDWSSAGITMAAPDPSLPSLSSFHVHHSVVFLDSTGYLNLLSHTPQLHYHWLKHEAATSMACLDDPASDGFQALFMTSVPFERSFDILFHISPPDVLYSSLANTNKGKTLLLDGGTWPLPLVLEQVFPILQRGLGKRIKLMAVRPFLAPQWFPSKAPLLPCDSHVTMGLLLDPDHASSVLDMGPPADSAEAAEFRVFWGEKAELRRFQDGSINEAVVWEGGSEGGKRGVVTQVIQHLLQRHAGVAAERVVSTAGALHPLISLPEYQTEEEGGQSSLLPPTGEETSKSIEDTFTEFTKQLRGLRGLPLAITSVQGASAVFRHTDVFPPLPWRGKTPRKLLAPPPKTSQSGCLYPSCDVATPPYVPALEVVLQLETSGKWPGELTAISCIKTSFYCYIGQALEEQFHLLSSPTEHYLDVLKSGYVFRLRIHHPRELLLLKDAISEAKPREASTLKSRLSEMEKALVQRPLVTSILHGLCQLYPVFGAGARLCKRWLSSHLLTNHIADEAVELMVAQLFINPAPFTTPNSPETALLRFLSLLSLHDWESQPLIVNLNNELSAVDLSEIGSQFSAHRSQLPPCFIATPLHRDSSPWTTPNPTLPVLSRTRLLAKESLSLLSTQLSSNDQGSIDFKQAFRSPMSDYNVLIHLQKKHLPLERQGVDVAMVTDSTHSHHHSHHPTHIPVTDFNPAEKYLAELESAFSEFALFFYDKYGGRVIAVVWKPQAFIPQPFRAMQMYCRIQASAETKGKRQSKAVYVPDMTAIISDFELMGEGLVHSVKVLSPPPTHSGHT